MVNRVRAFVLASLFAVALFAAVPSDPIAPGALAAGEDDLQHYRSWSIGDFWRYDKWAAEDSPANTKGEVTERVVSVERVTNKRFYDEEKFPAEWESHQVFRTRLWANQTANSGHGATIIKTEQVKFYRTADLGLVQMFQRDAYDFIQKPEENSGSERYREYYPPELTFDFPFAVGDKWRIGTTVYGYDPTGGCGQEGMPACNTTSQKVITYTVLGKETLRLTVNGQSQQIETYKIQALDELGIEDADHLDRKRYEIHWWSPKVCNLVKKETYSSKDELKDTWQLKDYKCKGRDAPDPNYAIYDGLNFSSIRRHGKLAVPPKLAEFNKAIADMEGDGGGIFGNQVQLGENLPGPHIVALLALAGLFAALLRRRHV